MSRYAQIGPQGDEFTVEMLREKSSVRLSRTEARTIVDKALKAGEIVLVRTLSNKTRIYKVIPNAEHINNDRPAGAGGKRSRAIV